MGRMAKDFSAWHQKKQLIDTQEFRQFVHEREIWWCSLGLNVGSEEDGKNEAFERPVLILKKFSKEVVLIIPITSKMRIGDLYRILDQVYLNRNDASNPSYFIISQIRLISTKRLTRRIRKLDSDTFLHLKWRMVLMILGGHP